MKKLFWTGCALLACSTAASAADMPVKAVPMVAPPVPAFSWTGCYVGGHVGFAEAHKRFRSGAVGEVLGINTGVNFPSSITRDLAADLFNANQVLVNSGDLDSPAFSGGIGGGQVGCNLQIAPSWVIGVEGDFSWARLRDTSFNSFSATRTATIPDDPDENNPGVITTTANGALRSNIDFLATVTARLGYTWDRVLLYAKGGGAFARDKFQLASTASVTVTQIDPDCRDEGDCTFTGTRAFVFDAKQDRWGWTVGAGAEVAIFGNWTFKVEYDFLDFGTRSTTFTDVNFGAFDVDVRQHVHEFKVGLNYLINWGKSPAVVARY